MTSAYQLMGTSINQMAATLGRYMKGHLKRPYTNLNMIMMQSEFDQVQNLYLTTVSKASSC